MLALQGRLMATDRFALGYVGPTGEAQVAIILEQGMPALTATGVLGEPRTASAERGEVCLDRLAAFLGTKIAEQARQLSSHASSVTPA
jgi:creatinine amidohydrolase/Fe(II)-dependent formamide hydrolase-like protein